MVVFGLVVAGVEALVLWYYWDYGYERVRFEILISTSITIAVGLPALCYVIYQHVALALLNERLVHLSAIDQMTGLLNRQTFVERLDRYLLHHGHSRSAGVLAYIDADHFKALNDRFGHAFGDKVIGMLADRIREAARHGDLCARLGGEEFGIFLANAAHDESAAIAESLRREVEIGGLQLNMPGYVISVSIGLAVHRPGLSAIDIMREADRSLYTAKRGGRNAVVIELKHYRAA
jgi:diguanylate cyclase (GGDEF)-like protein